MLVLLMSMKLGTQVSISMSMIKYKVSQYLRQF